MIFKARGCHGVAVEGLSTLQWHSGTPEGIKGKYEGSIWT